MRKITKARLALVVLLLLPSAALSQSLSGQRSKITPALMHAIEEAKANKAPVRTLIVLKDRVDLAALDRQLYERNVSLQERASIVINTLQEKARQTQGAILAQLQAQSSPKITSYQSFWIANIIALEALPEIVMAFSEHPDVDYLELDAKAELIKPVDTVPAHRSGQIVRNRA